MSKTGLIKREDLHKIYMLKGKDKLRLATVINELEILPAVDAVAVVRCKDCVHLRPAKDWDGNSYDACYLKANVCIFRRNTDDFCSYGERRDENAVD